MSQKIALSVNLNKIALIRNSREGNFPNIVNFAIKALEYGAKGLTVHPRPDQRHIKPNDVFELAKRINQHNQAENQSIEFNIEGNPFAPAKDDYIGLIEFVKKTKPNQCTLVPDSESQKTSDHGFNLTQDAERLIPIIKKLQTYGTRVSLFMDPVPNQITLAKKIGADRIELYTGPFALAYQQDSSKAQEIFQAHITAANIALKLGLGVNAGHDLNLNNMQLYKTLPGLKEVSIGHALTVDALLIGWQKAIEQYLALCR